MTMGNFSGFGLRLFYFIIGAIVMIGFGGDPLQILILTAMFMMTWEGIRFLANDMNMHLPSQSIIPSEVDIIGDCHLVPFEVAEFNKITKYLTEK